MVQELFRICFKWPVTLSLKSGRPTSVPSTMFPVLAQRRGMSWVAPAADGVPVVIVIAVAVSAAASAAAAAAASAAAAAATFCLGRNLCDCVHGTAAPAVTCLTAFEGFVRPAVHAAGAGKIHEDTAPRYLWSCYRLLHYWQLAY